MTGFQRSHHILIQFNLCRYFGFGELVQRLESDRELFSPEQKKNMVLHWREDRLKRNRDKRKETVGMDGESNSDRRSLFFPDGSSSNR